MIPSKFIPLNFISTVFLSFPSLSLSSRPLPIPVSPMAVRSRCDPPSCLPFLSPNTALFTALTKSFSTVGSSSVLNSGKISPNILSISSFLAKFKGVFILVSFTFSSFLPSILASAFLYSSFIDPNSSSAFFCILVSSKVFSDNSFS